MAFNHFYTVTRFYTLFFLQSYIALPCMCLSVSQMPPPPPPPHTHLVHSRFTSIPCGDEGRVFICVRHRSSDGSCRRVKSVSVSFSRLHESEHFRCIVAVVTCVSIIATVPYGRVLLHPSHSLLLIPAPLYRHCLGLILHYCMSF